MKKPRHRLSDHAVLRYLERAQGVDVETIRRELGARIDAACDGQEGMCAVNIDGMRFCLGEAGVVTTCFEQNRPDRGHSGPPRKRCIE